MDTILNIISELQECVLNYDISNLMKNVTILVDEIIKNIDKFNDKNINTILYNSNIALTNKDYLYYNDILQYDLKPIVKSLKKEVGE